MQYMLYKILLELKRYSIEYLICVPPGTFPAAVWLRQVKQKTIMNSFINT